MEEEILKTATVPETASVASDIDLAVTSANIDDVYLETKRIELKEDADAMSKNIGADLANKSIKDRDEADELRDNLEVAFIYLLKGFMLWHNKPEFQVAAERLMRIVDTHGGNFAKANRETETGLYDALLLDLKKPGPLADLATLNISDLLTDMETAETNCKDLNQQVVAEKTEKSDYIAPSSIKRKVMAKIDELSKYLGTMAKVQPNIYGIVASKVQHLIADINQKVRNRLNSKPDTNKSSNN